MNTTTNITKHAITAAALAAGLISSVHAIDDSQTAGDSFRGYLPGPIRATQASAAAANNPVSSNTVTAASAATVQPTAAALAAGFAVQTVSIAAEPSIHDVPESQTVSSKAAVADSEAVARENWRTAVSKMDLPEKGCFHASYPNYVLEKIECKAAPDEVQVRGNVGKGLDDVAVAHGLIGEAIGTFPSSNATSVTTTGAQCKDLGLECYGVNGNGQYSIQLNTNNDQWTSACLGGSSKCRVWQQFMYYTQWKYTFISDPFGSDDKPALYIQFWLLDYGSHCPDHWTSSGEADCVLNSAHVTPPLVPVSRLSEVKMQANVLPGGKDVLRFIYDGELYAVTDNDNTLQIGTVWRSAEFNIVGAGGLSEAVFDTGTTIQVGMTLSDGTQLAPGCNPNGGTTGETNNLNLQVCSSSVNPEGPAISFTESTNVGRVNAPPH